MIKTIDIVGEISPKVREAIEETREAAESTIAAAYAGLLDEPVFHPYEN